MKHQELKSMEFKRFKTKMSLEKSQTEMLKRWNVVISMDIFQKICM